MSKFKIESGIPVPQAYLPHKYPFREMNVGQSFLEPDVKREKSLRVYASQAKKKFNGKFSVRKVADGLRVWRVE